MLLIAPVYQLREIIANTAVYGSGWSILTTQYLIIDRFDGIGKLRGWRDWRRVALTKRVEVVCHWLMLSATGFASAGVG